MKFLMCRPDHYGIKYSINPWMDVGNGSSHELAVEQWNSLRETLENLGASLFILEQNPEVPDMVFTANAGLIYHNHVFLSRFKHSVRQGEEVLFKTFFESAGFTVHVPEEHYEGAGDSLFMGRHLICGYGFRSDLNVYMTICTKLNITGKAVKLQDPRFYHLDTCFCPLENGDYLVYPGAFTEAGLALLSKVGKRALIVNEEDACRFACNAVCIGSNVVLPSGCDRTYEMLSQHGYTPIPLPMTEFLKAGGACKCLTLRLG